MSAAERGQPSHFEPSEGRRRIPEASEVPLSELLRRFAQDASALVRHEIALAKLEMRDSLKGYAQDAARLGVAAGVGMIGAFALTAFVIVGLGSLIGNYWLSALLVALVLLGVAAIMTRAALAHLRRRNLAPETTVATLKQNELWAKREARDFKRKLKA
jgi:hypothetical protein